MGERLNPFLQRVDDALHRQKRKRPWLADQVGVSISTVNTWFKQNRIPRVDVAVQIAKALSATVEYLVTGEGEQVQEQIDPEYAALCRFLRGLSPKDLSEARGYLARYFEERRLGGRESGTTTSAAG
jgi:transcriptional regulator with XRE-family HTH domain